MEAVIASEMSAYFEPRKISSSYSPPWGPEIAQVYCPSIAEIRIKIRKRATDMFERYLTMLQIIARTTSACFYSLALYRYIVNRRQVKYLLIDGSHFKGFTLTNMHSSEVVTEVKSNK
jgi:hypothetical protein